MPKKKEKKVGREATKKEWRKGSLGGISKDLKPARKIHPFFPLWFGGEVVVVLGEVPCHDQRFQASKHVRTEKSLRCKFDLFLRCRAEEMAPQIRLCTNISNTF